MPQRKRTPVRRQNTNIEALRLSEERFALAMRAANFGLWDRNLQTGQVYYSPRWAGMLGYAEDEIGHDIRDFERLIHPDDRARRLDAVKAYLSGTAERYEVECRMRHKSGHYIPVLARATAANVAAGSAFL